MHNLKKLSRKTVVTATVMAISCGVTYYYEENRYATKIESLNDHIDSLEAKMLEARVTERISVQMGEIAAQESETSKRERDEADKQSRIADMERNKAMIEERHAKTSQAAAIVSAEEAKKAQREAEQQSKVALANELIAREARAHADTLRYLALSKSLAESSINQYNSDNNLDLARLLAYASWHYSQKYGGSFATQQTLYQALLNTTSTITDKSKATDKSLGIKGNVRKIHVLDDGTVAGITDYGDVFFISDNVITTDNIDKNNFRDFYTFGKKRSLALCGDGRIIEYEILDISKGAIIKDIRYSTVLTLPHGFWKRLIGYNHGKTLVAMSDNMIVWIDSKTMTVTAKAEIGKDIHTTCLGKQGNTIHIFCNNGTYYTAANPGELTLGNTTLPQKETISAFIYNKERGLQFFGTMSGHILVYDANGKKVTELTGHDDPITELHTWNNMLGSISYDKTIRLWNLEDIHSLIIPVTISYGSWLHTFDVNQATCTVWLGGDNGLVPNFCSNIYQNAEQTRLNIRREFTPDEWNLYVGSDIPQLYFMK